MKKNTTRIRTESSIESILALSPSLLGISSLKKSPDSIQVSADRVFKEAVDLLPNAHWVGDQLSVVDQYFDLSNHQEDSWGEESLEWKAYNQGCAHLKHSNRFHIIDLYRRATSTEWIDGDFELVAPNIADSLLPEEILSTINLRITVCLASLSSDNIMRILDGISQTKTTSTVFLCGSLADRKKSTLLTSGWGHKLKIIDLCGRQSLSALAATLKNADICFSGPGKAALLASGYGTFSICLDDNDNPLHYPYGHGHLVIKSTRSELFSESLANLTREVLNFSISGNGGNIPSIEQWVGFSDSCIDQFLSKIDLFITQRVAQQFPQGQKSQLKLRPLIFMGYSLPQLLGEFYQTAFERTLTSSAATPGSLVLQPETINELSGLLNPMEKLFELGHFGAIYSKQTRISLENGRVDLAKLDSDKVQEVETLILDLAKSFPAFESICLFHTKRQSLMWNSNPEEIALEMEALFEQFKSVVLVLLELSQSTFRDHLDGHLSASVESQSNQGEANV